MKRRTFLGAAAATAVASRAAIAADPPAETKRGDMRFRPLGSTGVDVSIIGLGGHHIGRQKDEADSIKIIHAAIDAGVNFMDNSWDYHDGGSEIRMGKALQGGFRAKVFLMTKFDGRTKKAAAEQIDESLKRLQTDVIDLIQVHEVIRLEDPDRIFADGGALEAVREAKKAGKVRFVGFTGHKDPLVHLRMLEVEAEHDFRFDTVQMPVNVLDAQFRSFTTKVLPLLVRDGVGAIGMKSMGDGLILKSKAVTPAECLRYSLSEPVSTLVTGIDSLAILKQNLEVVKTFTPLTPAERQALLAKSAKAAASGQFEGFKTTNAFDSTAKNPSWLGEPDKMPA
jgi:aryl-alcohol dehydrogenase-like predicted oxidoreductase